MFIIAYCIGVASMLVIRFGLVGITYFNSLVRCFTVKQEMEIAELKRRFEEDKNHETQK